MESEMNINPNEELFDIDDATILSRSDPWEDSCIHAVKKSDLRLIG